MKKLRPHQEAKAKEVLDTLTGFDICYLHGEVRSGKTLTVLESSKLYKAKKVLFLTKKKAIDSIMDDYNDFGYTFDIQVINYESVHKVEDNDFDLVIYDEAHVLSAFPKPSKRVKIIKDRFSHIPCILLSGTPAAESNSQYYHQFFVSDYSPFRKYKNFYNWAHDFVDIRQKRIGTHTVNDYSETNPETWDMAKTMIDLVSVIMTQEDAGFEVDIKEHILNVPCPEVIHKLAKRLIRDRAIEGKNGYIMAEMPAKLQSKVHQIYNGSVILETLEGETIPFILSHYKAEFIRDKFQGKKIAIMYYYQSELKILQEVFGDDLTTDLDEFNSTPKNFAIQQSSVEGMNISAADCLVYYNFGFSGKNYIQSRDRLTVKERTDNDVYFILETPGINHMILHTVRKKKTYNSRLFLKDFA